MSTTKLIQSLTNRSIYHSRVAIVRQSHLRFSTNKFFVTESTKHKGNENSETKLNGAKSPSPLTEREHLLDDIHENEEIIGHPSIPAPPPKIKGYPTPWITEKEFINHLAPLFPLGWGFQFSRINSKFSPAKLEDQTSSPLVPQLLRTYQFPDFNASIDFVNEIARLAREENHHPAFTVTDPGIPQVSVFTHTDSSIRPQWSELIPDLPLLPSESRSARKCSGITLRDLRLAILLEEAYSLTPYYRTNPSIDRTPSWWQFTTGLKQYYDDFVYLRRM